MSRWPTEKAARIGYLLGQGRTAPDVARILDDGTSAWSVAYAKRAWGLVATAARGVSEFAFPLGPTRKAKLAKVSGDLGIEPAEFIRRITVCVLDDDLYGAVTDGRFA